jgi:GR25 family glycosyltransferase involved in LPS biosynthesis
MKLIFILIVTWVISLTPGIASMEVINWQKISLRIPSNWKGVQTPMPSLHGYFLNTKIANKTIRFFIHAHKPLSVPTDKLVQDYWIQFLDNKTLNPDCKNISIDSKLSSNAYQCSHIAQKDDDKSKWMLQTMYWLSDTERLLVTSSSFDSQKEAQYALDSLQVVFP